MLRRTDDGVAVHVAGFSRERVIECGLPVRRDRGRMDGSHFRT